LNVRQRRNTVKTRTKKVFKICGVLVVLGAAAYFSTARYGSDGAGFHFISRAPILNISWGPRSRFIVDEGLNFVPDRGRGMAGNVIEFGLPFSESRISLRIFSRSWARYEYDAWRSNHAVETKEPNQTPEPTAPSGRGSS
jgi:hypothetical protein